MKAGTTSLHSFLGLHPDIFMSNAKEINYFNAHYSSKPENWYKNQFSKTMVSGEATPAYSWVHKYPEVPARIYEFNPDMKIIYLLRDPIDRIISHLHHDLYRDRIALIDLPEILFEDPHYINSSKYWFQLNSYLKYFNQNQICLIQTEDLKTKPYETLNRICSFLEVKSYNSKIALKSRNTGSKRYLIKKHDFVHDNFPKKLVKLYHWFFYFLNIKIERPELNRKTLDRIKTELKQDMRKLEENFKYDLNFNHWNL